MSGGRDKTKGLRGDGRPRSPGRDARDAAVETAPSRPSEFRAGVLATVIVVSALLLLALAGLMWLWELDFTLFSHSNRRFSQQADIESAFTVYRHDPSIMERLAADGTYQLYDSLPASRVKITRFPWGLYDAVEVASPDGRTHSTRLMGAAEPGGGVGAIWYADNGGALTLSGRTNIKGPAALPRGGVVYGQMQSLFFSGDKLPPGEITRSGNAIPPATARAREAVRSLFALKGEGLRGDTMRVSFHRTPTLVADLGSGALEDCDFSGNIILRGDRLHIAASCRLTDVIVVGRSVSVADGFRGRVQLLASDSVVTGKNVVLESPSGIFSALYAELGDESEVNGYLIVDRATAPGALPTPPETDIRKPNLRKSRTSRLRGLLYADGVALVQGLVTGAAVVGQTVYYSPQGYYRHMLHEAVILESDAVHYPLWLENPKGGREAGWVE